ncbi:MAG: acyl-CoA dehydrogenase family protein [Arhodomonas sp.]|nr:acyl-CoA dehydrogenase family protein [Arhodomonas sp.]
MATLDVFRSTVGAAALGFARRALDEALARVRHAAAVRRQPLADLQLAQATLADMALRRRCRRPARLPRRLGQGLPGASASPARPPWPSSTPPSRPSK